MKAKKMKRFTIALMLFYSTFLKSFPLVKANIDSVLVLQSDLIFVGVSIGKFELGHKVINFTPAITLKGSALDNFNLVYDESLNNCCEEHKVYLIFLKTEANKMVLLKSYDVENNYIIDENGNTEQLTIAFKKIYQANRAELDLNY